MTQRTETLPKRSILPRQTKNETTDYLSIIDSITLSIINKEFIPHRKSFIPFLMVFLIGYIFVNTDIDVNVFQNLTLSSITTKTTLAFCKMEDPRSTCSISFTKPDFALCYYSPNGLNFGEQLGLAVTKQLLSNYFTECLPDFAMYNLAVKADLEERESSNITCLFTSGSIIHLAKPGDHIWGAGITPYKHIVTTNSTNATALAIAPNLVIHAVRGPRTWDLFESYQKQTTLHVDSSLVKKQVAQSIPRMIYGDPAALMKSLYPHLFEQKRTSDEDLRQYCVIPHVRDFLDSPLLQELKGSSTRSSKVFIVSPLGSWEQVVLKIVKDCKYVASTSLYGLIVAESLGLPTLWFQEKNRIISNTDGTFKYSDFYDSIGVEGTLPVSGGLGMADISNPQSYREPISESNRELYADVMIASFPYHLFQATCLTTTS